MGGDLRQMGDAQDLVSTTEQPEAPTHRIRAAAANARIDLIEDQRRGRVGLGKDLLDRQRDARQLAA